MDTIWTVKYDEQLRESVVVEADGTEHQQWADKEFAQKWADKLNKMYS